MRVGRFRGRKDLRRVLSIGVRQERPGVSLRCLPGGVANHRMAVVCPKRAVPKAVERNRVKRVFFDSVAAVLRDFDSPLDCALIVRKSGLDARSFRRRDADAMIEDALRKIASRICGN